MCGPLAFFLLFTLSMAFKLQLEESALVEDAQEDSTSKRLRVDPVGFKYEQNFPVNSAEMEKEGVYLSLIRDDEDNRVRWLINVMQFD